LERYIDYAVVCHKGKVRSDNQDNFWCAGRYLESENDGLAAPIVGTAKCGDRPVFGVFDGLGGESHGELAAYFAAKTFDALCGGDYGGDIRRFLIEGCHAMNNVICSYVKQENCSDMGTTAALIGFDDREAHVCNVGDSKVYRYAKRKLAQVSYDHVTDIARGRKPALSQCLGIPEDDFVIEPYHAGVEYFKGDRFLLCSDGLTDMLTAKEIRRVLAKRKTVAKCVEILLEAALTAGGADNITAMLCEVSLRE
jgi:protein phosphatase